MENMMHNTSSTNVYCVFFMEGLHEVDYDQVITSWGQGAVELGYELASYAFTAERMTRAAVTARNDDLSFPGVFEYEVCSPFGKWFGTQILNNLASPTQKECVEYLREAVTDFFMQGEPIDRQNAIRDAVSKVSFVSLQDVESRESIDTHTHSNLPTLTGTQNHQGVRRDHYALNRTVTEDLENHVKWVRENFPDGEAEARSSHGIEKLLHDVRYLRGVLHTILDGVNRHDTEGHYLPRYDINLAFDCLDTTDPDQVSIGIAVEKARAAFIESLDVQFPLAAKENKGSVLDGQVRKVMLAWLTGIDAPAFKNNSVPAPDRFVEAALNKSMTAAHEVLASFHPPLAAASTDISNQLRQLATEWLLPNRPRIDSTPEVFSQDSQHAVATVYIGHGETSWKFFVQIDKDDLAVSDITADYCPDPESEFHEVEHAPPASVLALFKEIRPKMIELLNAEAERTKQSTMAP